MGAGILGSRGIIYRRAMPTSTEGLGTDWAPLLVSSPLAYTSGGQTSDTFNQDNDGWIDATIQHSTTSTARNAPRNNMLTLGWDLADINDPSSILPFYNPDGSYNGHFDAELVIELDTTALPGDSEEMALFVGWCVNSTSLNQNSAYNYTFAGWQYGATWSVKYFRSTNSGESTASTSIPNKLSPHLHLRAGSSFRCVLVAPLDDEFLDYNGGNGLTPLVFPSQLGPQQLAIAIGSNKTSQPAGTTYNVRFRPWWRLTYRPRVDLTRPADD